MGTGEAEVCHVCKLENKESRGITQSESSLRTKGAYGVTSGVRPKVRERTEKGKGKRGTLVYFLESEVPQTRNSDVQGQEKTDVRGQEERERNLPSLYLFAVFRPSPEWMRAAHTGEGGSLLDRVITLQTNPEIMFHQLCGHPLAQ